MPEDTENTSTGAENTDNSGQSTSNGGNANQDDTVARLKDYEQKLEQLAGLEAEKAKLEQLAKTSQAEALRWQSSYKSLQSNTTASLQEAARTRQQLQEQQRLYEALSAMQAETAQMREGLSFLASKMIDEDAAREFNLRQRESQIKQQEDRARQVAEATRQQQQQPVQQQTQYVDLAEQKRQFLDYYFPNSGIDPNDPGIDWGEGANDTREAFRRFTTSVQTRIAASKVQNEEVKSEAQQLLEQLRKDREQLEADRNAAAEEAKAVARREVEQRARKLGIDAGSSGTSTASDPKIQTKLQEIDETRLMSGEPSARKKAAKEMEEELRILRQQYLNQYRQQ